MPVRSDDPLRKVTINLYDSDVRWMEKEYGHGWSERLRQDLHYKVIEQRKFKPIADAFIKRTLGDLPND